jgi:hypothetical protein
MKIRAADGSIVFTTCGLGSDTSLERFVRSEAGRRAKATVVNEERRHYEFDPEPGVGAIIFFRGAAIDRIHLTMSLPSDSAREWSERRELQRKTMHDAWLRTELGEPPYAYKWGRVTSDYDAHGCASEIIVVYDR